MESIIGSIFIGMCMGAGITLVIIKLDQINQARKIVDPPKEKSNPVQNLSESTITVREKYVPIWDLLVIDTAGNAYNVEDMTIFGKLVIGKTYLVKIYYDEMYKEFNIISANGIPDPS